MHRSIRIASVLTSAFFLTVAGSGAAHPALPGVPKTAGAARSTLKARVSAPLAAPTAPPSFRGTFLPSSAPAPQSAQAVPQLQVVSGSVTAVTKNTIAVTSASGRSGTITLPANGVQNLHVRAGSAVATVSTNGGRTVRVFAAAPSVRGSLPAGAVKLIGTVVSHSATALLLRTAGGQLYTLQCACTTPQMLQIANLTGQTVFAVASGGGALVSAAPLPGSTQLFGQIVAFDASTMALLTPDGQVLEISCACGAMQTSGLAPGDFVVVNIDAHARTVSLKALRKTRKRSPAVTVAMSRIVIVAAGDYVAGDCSERSANVIGVHVNSAATNLPLFHASIRLQGKATSARVLSSQSGYASFQDVPPGRYRVSVEKAGLHSALSRPFQIGCRRAVALRAMLAPVR